MPMLRTRAKMQPVAGDRARRGMHVNTKHRVVCMRKIIMKNKPELLAPAGSYETMKAAINAGADAVYIGGRLFGARAYADNPEDELLLEAVDYVHMRGRKLYLTVNTLLKDNELNDMLYNYLKPLYICGLDAVIVQDFGVMRFIQEHFPKLHIHASTQMTITGALGARFLSEQRQVTRVVTARELSLEEISEIRDTCDLEIESFVHGALCYSYSGQCLFSSLAGGRSGNRGRCAQPCRMQYREAEGREGYYISPKDLCTIDILPDILEAGVTSLKIEGRMKKPEYTAGVVSVYRKYLDKYLSDGGKDYKVAKEDKQLLLDLFNRGGFTEGYYRQHNGKSMIFIKGKTDEDKGRNDALFERMRADYIDCTENRLDIEGEAYIYAGQPARLTVRRNGLSVTVEGEPVQPARNMPMSSEKIEKQLCKLGATEFAWAEPPKVFTDGESFISVTGLNGLRRLAAESIREKLLAGFRREESAAVRENTKTEYAGTAGRDEDEYLLYAYIEDIKVLRGLITGCPKLDGYCLDMASFSDNELWEGISMCNAAGKQIYPVLPHIFRKRAVLWLDRIYEKLDKSDIDGFVVRNQEELQYLKEHDCTHRNIFDYTLYGYNASARSVLDEYLPEMYTLPVELNAKELTALNTANGMLLVYGRLPMMVSAQCVRKTMGKGECEGFKGAMYEEQLTDRMNNIFPVKNYCSLCYNRVYNCKPVSLLTQTDEIKRIAPRALRLDFTTETPKQAQNVAEKFIMAFKEGSVQEEIRDFTRGHFKRGIG